MTTLTVSRTLKNNRHAIYKYQSIGGVPIGKYMNQKLKERRQQSRFDRDKLLFDEVGPETRAQMREQFANNESISAISRSNGVSWYLTRRICTET